MEKIEEENEFKSSLFIPSSKSFENATEFRKKEREGILSFGVSFLDDCLNGISKRDLILLGGRTGTGKTELASLIAQHNALLGKKVHMFALEAAPMEIENRITFRVIAEQFKKLYPSIQIVFNYKDWLNGKIDERFIELEQGADAYCAKLFINLSVCYKPSKFVIEDLIKELLFIQHDTDLIILDHLHYIDLEDDDENRAMKSLVQQLRNTALDIGKPIIALAHLRKSDKRFKTIVPDLEDFHGSSDITKIATSCILLAPDYEVQFDDKTLWPTYMRIAKCREDGSRTRYIARTVFNFKTNSYEKKYQLGLVSKSNEEFKPLEEYTKPHWANRKE